MTRVVFDTNVYISALEFGGVPLHLLEQARAGRFALFISIPIIREAQKVFGEKFHWPEERLDQFERSVLQFTTKVEPRQQISVVKVDPDDDRILECAVEAEAEAIITGDKHLLQLGEYQGVAVYTVSNFLRKQRL